MTSRGALKKDDNGVAVGWNGKHVAAGTATTTVKSSAGVLHAIVINTKGASANVLTIYDGDATGAVIAVIDTTVTFGTLYYDIAFATALTAVSATGTGADFTVSYI